MIGSVSGTVASIGADFALVEVGGVGLVVSAPQKTLLELRLGSTVRLFTSLVVREDALTLYGFANEDEKNVFEVLQRTKGIGPRLALGALDTLEPDQLRLALANKDEKLLVKIPGVGKRTAQRMILEIADKLGPATATAIARPSSGISAEVVAGLVQLGWHESAAEAAVSMHDDGHQDASSLLRLALQTLGKHNG